LDIHLAVQQQQQQQQQQHSAVLPLQGHQATSAQPRSKTPYSAAAEISSQHHSAPHVSGFWNCVQCCMLWHGTPPHGTHTTPPHGTHTTPPHKNAYHVSRDKLYTLRLRWHYCRCLCSTRSLSSQQPVLLWSQHCVHKPLANLECSPTCRQTWCQALCTDHPMALALRLVHA
jgi:hypothetical protein